ncbi:hypothetical protein QWJ38_14595 [Pelomonas sp. PFR6]|uniref:Uncharacterized protein n=1 Tax=Roseateles violae TaxID=3058042 RepID=A0ABT8DT78_9BURK|nr:hypothetical protein [Pelomonas sp. PFR6]
MDPRNLLHFAPAFVRPVLSALLDRLDAIEKRLAELERRSCNPQEPNA